MSEFHSGYRIYSVKTLEGILYRLNSNDFHFDTEVIIQLLNAGREDSRSCPSRRTTATRFCRVNGMKYAKDVLWATLQNVAHRSGLLHQRRFEPVSAANAHYDLKLGYSSSHTYALDASRPGSRCSTSAPGPGRLTRELRNKGCDVTVVDQHAPAVPVIDVKVITQDLEDPPKFDSRQYEVLLMLDIVEHLRDPERFLEELRKQFEHDPKKLILTTPNVAFLCRA